MWLGRAKRAPATYTKTCPRPPERGRCKGKKNLKQREPGGGALKSVPGGSLRESAASVGGFQEGGSISGASFCICGCGERSEPWPHIQRLARGLRREKEFKAEEEPGGGALKSVRGEA